MHGNNEGNLSDTSEDEAKSGDVVERGRFPKRQPSIKMAQKRKMKHTEDPEAVEQSTGRSKRRLAQCIVEGCRTNENSKKPDGSNYVLYDAPKDKAGRLRWALYVPEVDCAVHLLRYCKVCELHFVDGEPTRENPFPSQNLHPAVNAATAGGAAAALQSPRMDARQMKTLETEVNISNDEDNEDELSEDEDDDDFKPAFKISKCYI